MAYWTVSGGCPAVGDEVEVKCHAEGAPAVALAARIGAEAGAVFVAWGGGGGGGGGGTACGSVPSPVLPTETCASWPSEESDAAVFCVYSPSLPSPVLHLGSPYCSSGPLPLPNGPVNWPVGVVVLVLTAALLGLYIFFTRCRNTGQRRPASADNPDSTTADRMFDKPGGRFLPAAPAEPSPRAASPATRLGTEPGSIRRALRFATERILARERVVVAAQPAAVPKAASPAEFVKRRCEEAAAKQAREPAIVRTTLTGEHINAAQAFVEWSARAGMHARIVDVRCDPATGEAVAEVDTPATALKLAAGGSDTRVACCRPPAAARPLPPVPDAREYSPDEPSPDALSPETVAVTIDGGGPPPASFASACSKSPPRRANPPPTAAGSDAGGDEASCDSPIPAFARGGSETPVASRGCYSAGAGSENLGQAKSASVASHGARRGPAEPRLYPTLEPDPCMNRTADTDESLWRDDSSLQLADLDSRRHGATAEQRLGSVRPAAVVMSPLRHQADEEKDERHPKQNPDPAFSSVASSASASGFYTAPSGHSKVTDDRFSVPRVAPDPSRESCGTLHSAPEAREASVSGGSNWCDQRTVSERLAISLKQQQAQKHSPCRAEAAEGGRRAEASRLNPLHEQAPARLAGWLEDHNRPRQVTAGNHPASIMGGELSRM